MQELKMIRQYWIDRDPYPVGLPGYFEYKPSLLELRSDVKSGFSTLSIQIPEMSAFSLTLYRVLDFSTKNREHLQPVLTLMYMWNGRYKLCMNQTSDDMPPFNPY